jgi:hypothetical protein
MNMRLSNFTPKQKLKQRNSTLMTVFHFTVKVGSTKMNITRTIKMK